VARVEQDQRERSLSSIAQSSSVSVSFSVSSLSISSPPPPENIPLEDSKGGDSAAQPTTSSIGSYCEDELGAGLCGRRGGESWMASVLRFPLLSLPVFV
jgi:hypothetical protein